MSDGEAFVDVALFIVGEVETEDETRRGGVEGDEVIEKLRETQTSSEDDEAVLDGEVFKDLAVEGEDRGCGGEGERWKRRERERRWRWWS